jgi:uncharacterized membrane protein HdeD (DUF308 family)
MRSVNSIRAAKIGYILMSVCFCVLGLVLMLRPQLSVRLVGTFLGVALVVFGIIKLVGYFSKDLYRLAFQYDLAFGILLLALGLLVLLKPDRAMGFLCAVLGVAVLADGLFKIQMSVDARRFGLRSWLAIALLAVLACIIGGVLVFRPTESAGVLMVLLGICLLAEGLLNLCVALCAVKIVRHQRPDIIDVEINE